MKEVKEVKEVKSEGKAHSEEDDWTYGEYGEEGEEQPPSDGEGFFRYTWDWSYAKPAEAHHQNDIKKESEKPPSSKSAWRSPLCTA